MPKKIGRIDEEYKAKEVKIDAKDRKILQELSRDSRLSATQLAKKVQLSRDAVSYRINRLHEKRVILRCYPEIKYLRLGFYEYHVFLQIDEMEEEQSRKFVEDLKSHPNMVNLIQYSDRWDLELVLLARDVIEFDRLLTELLINYSDVIIEKDTIEVIKTYSLSHVPYDIYYTDDYDIKGGTIPIKLDKSDLKILSILSNNCRISNYQVSQQVALSPDAVRYRIKALLDKKVIKKFTILPNHSLLNYDWYTFAVQLRTFNSQQEARFKTFVNQNPNILRAVKTMGTWDLLLYVVTSSPKEFHAIVKKIKNTFAKIILNYQTWIAFKEDFFEPFPPVSKQQ